MIHPVHKYILT